MYDVTASSHCVLSPVIQHILIRNRDHEQKLTSTVMSYTVSLESLWTREAEFEDKWRLAI